MTCTWWSWATFVTCPVTKYLVPRTKWSPRTVSFRPIWSPQATDGPPWPVLAVYVRLRICRHVRRTRTKARHFSAKVNTSKCAGRSAEQRLIGCHCYIKPSMDRCDSLQFQVLSSIKSQQFNIITRPNMDINGKGPTARTLTTEEAATRTSTTCVSMQSASMLQCTEDYVQFRVENTQIQEGGADCGLFAIAFATEHCFGNNPECYR